MRRREPDGEPGKRQGGQGAAAMLLRLREADVVRLCGLRAAAQGLDYASRHAVTRQRRHGARLLASVLPTSDSDDPAPSANPTACDVWCEAIEAPPAPLAIHWGCSCQPNDPSPIGTLGCPHVAALLTAWIRAPGDFRAFTDEAAAPDKSPSSAASPRLPQPATLRIGEPPADDAPQTPERPAGRLTLTEELRRLSGTDALALARRLTGALSDAPGDQTPAAAAALSLVSLDQPPTETEARALAADILSDPRRLAPIVARLDPDAQSLLNDLMLLGGAITAADLHALGERAGRASSATQNAISALERFGLVFRVVRMSSPTVSGASSDGQHGLHDARQAWRRITGWRIAPEVRAALPIRLTTPADEAALRRAPRVRTLRASPRPLCLGLALLARAPAPLGPFGVTPVEGRAQPEQAHTGAAATLAPGDLPPTRLAELARGAGLPPGQLRMARRVLLWAREQAPGQPLTDLASAPVGERALALRGGFRLWRAADSAVDLVDLEAPDSPVRMRYDLRSPAFRPAALASEATEARQFVIALLAHAEPGVWYTFDDLLALIWRVNPLFLRGRQQAYTIPAWRLERTTDGRPLRPTVRDEWLAGEGAYLRALLCGPLHWWGALDLLAPIPAGQQTPAPHALAFRLTDLGAYLLMDAPGAVDATTPTSEARAAKTAEALAGDWGAPLLLTREGALAAHPLAASSSQLNALGAWARPTGVAGGRLIYTLSVDLACAAFDHDQTPADAIAAIQATGRVAERVQAQLQSWREAYGDARIGVGWALLEARDEAALHEALAYAPTIAARTRLLSPTLALVHPTDLDALRAALTRKGYAV